MKELRKSVRSPRRDRLIRERVHDPYKMRRKLPEPTVCPQCQAVYRDGRWEWGDRPADAHEELCQACHRINDKYPAGELTLKGDFLRRHRLEVEHLARNEERLENGEHPLNRIMAIEDRGEDLLITTTDIHLPRRIGDALHRAYEGELDYHYDEESHFIRVSWRRES